MKPPIPTERELQRAILKMCRSCFPDVFIHHSPNGARSGSSRKSRMITGGIAKADGAVAGFPDLACYWDGGHLLLEVKREKGGVVSDAQKAVHRRLSDIGWPVSIVRCEGEAWGALVDAGAPYVGRLA